MIPKRRKPTREELSAAYGKGVRDVIAPGLKVLLVGINPGLYTAAIGHHFGRPGNRFWPSLHAGGFTERLLSPYESRELLKSGYGITNLVNKATVTADELTAEQLQEGAKRLEKKIRRYRPAIVAFLGVTSYRIAYGRKRAILGPQQETIGNTRIWVLPNPSGLNAHHQLKDLGPMFRALRLAVQP